jgi:hypothetical protein
MKSPPLSNLAGLVTVLSLLGPFLPSKVAG